MFHDSAADFVRDRLGRPGVPVCDSTTCCIASRLLWPTLYRSSIVRPDDLKYALPSARLLENSWTQTAPSRET
nr:unnamed protein product [Digitaria exilis]